MRSSSIALLTVALSVAGNTFLLEAIPCPEPSFYSAYKKVGIMYEAP